MTQATQQDRAAGKDAEQAKIETNSLSYLIALHLMHHHPTGNDIQDAMLYRMIYADMRRWLAHTEHTGTAGIADR